MITYTAEKYASVTAFKPISKINGMHFFSQCTGDLTPVFKTVTDEHPEIDVIYSDSYNSFFDDMHICFYSPEFIKYYSPNITDGKWLSENSAKYTDVIPAVSFGKYSVGEKLHIKDNIYLEIIGVSNDSRHISFDYYGSDMNTQMLMENSKKNMVMALINPYISEKLYLHSDDSRNVALLMTKADTDLPLAAEVLKEYGTLNSFDDILANGKSYAFEQFRLFLPFFVFAYVLALFGIISGVVLTISKNMDMFSIMYIVGATRTQCGIIVAVNIAFHVVGTFVLYKIVASVMLSTIRGIFGNILLVAMLICCALVIIASAIPLCALRKDRIIQILKADR